MGKFDVDSDKRKYLYHLTNLAQGEHEQPPLLFVDINIGEGQKPRIVVYSHDDPQKVAYKFAK